MSPARGEGTPSFEWKDGDRVVLIGDALIEREQTYGYLETFVSIRHPDKTITFRNLGWSGDTPFGTARARFGKEEDGFQHLKDHVLALEPTVLVVGYGMTDSFDGAAGLPRFRQGMDRLLDALAPTHARLVLLSPIAHEDLGRPLPDPAQHNRSLRLYRDAIRDIARERGAVFVDLLAWFERRPSPPRPSAAYSDEGIHLNHEGYWSCAVLLSRTLDGAEEIEAGAGDESGDAARPLRRVRLGADGKLREAQGPFLARAATTPAGLRCELTRRFLPPPASPGGKTVAAPLVLVVDDLPEGRYTLSIDGRTVARANAREWSKPGVTCAAGPEQDQVERLRRAVIEKDRFYFYRWRPQNETYLFGFRKYEQGNNAREVPLFDPLVAEKETEIARLKVPVEHVYELIREEEEAK